MTLYILKNKSYLDENSISLSWQKESIFRVNLKLNI